MNKLNPTFTTFVKFRLLKGDGFLMVIAFGYGLQFVNLRKGEWMKGNGRGMVHVLGWRIVLLMP